MAITPTPKGPGEQFSSSPIILILTHLPTGESYFFDWMPHQVGWRHSNSIAEEIAPGRHDPITQFVGGQTTDLTIAVRLVGNDAASKARKWKYLMDQTDGQWAQPPVFLVSGLDEMFDGEMVIVANWQFDINPNHLINRGSPGSTRLGDITLTITLKRAKTYAANAVYGPGM